MTLSAEEQSENCSFGVRKSFAQVRSQFSLVCCYLVCGRFFSFYVFFIFFIFSSLSFSFLPFSFTSVSFFFLFIFFFYLFPLHLFHIFFPFYIFLFLPFSFKLALVSDASVKRLNRHQNCFPTLFPSAVCSGFSEQNPAKRSQRRQVDGCMDGQTDGWMDLVPRQTSRWELLPDPAAWWRFFALRPPRRSGARAPGWMRPRRARAELCWQPWPRMRLSGGTDDDRYPADNLWRTELF